VSDREQDIAMAATDGTHIVDSCIQSLMDLTNRSGGFPDSASIRDRVLATLALVGHDAAAAAQGKRVLEETLRTKANLLAAGAPEAARVLMQAYRIATTTFPGEIQSAPRGGLPVRVSDGSAVRRL
jgi:hypothetical protein